MDADEFRKRSIEEQVSWVILDVKMLPIFVDLYDPRTHPPTPEVSIYSITLLIYIIGSWRSVIFDEMGTSIPPCAVSIALATLHSDMA